MKLRNIINMGLPILLLAVSLAAKAQLGFSVTDKEVPTEEDLRKTGVTLTDRNRVRTITGNKNYGSVGIYPIAAFARAGVLAGGGVGTATKMGGLFTADFGLRHANASLPLEVGGWYWNAGNADLYQIHIRTFVTREIGFQVAYLNSAKVDSNSYTLFAIYELNSKRISPLTKRPWGVQFGLGALIDASGGTTTTHFTTFVQGSIRLSGNLSANAGEWYLRDRTTDLNRFTVGLGYGF